MNSTELKLRTKKFALRVIHLTRALKNDYVEVTIGKQILRSGTSVGANYRAACLAKSTSDFIYKLKIIEEELDETLYWMELLIEAELIPQAKLLSLQNECTELYKIISRSIKTSKSNIKPASKIRKSVNP